MSEYTQIALNEAKRRLEDYDRLREINAELLAALKACLRHGLYEDPSVGGDFGGMAPTAGDGRASKIEAQANAAIARAEGEGR